MDIVAITTKHITKGLDCFRLYVREYLPCISHMHLQGQDAVTGIAFLYGIGYRAKARQNSRQRALWHGRRGRGTTGKRENHVSHIRYDGIADACSEEIGRNSDGN